MNEKPPHASYDENEVDVGFDESDDEDSEEIDETDDYDLDEFVSEDLESEDEEEGRKILCLTCRHNIGTTSCGACISSNLGGLEKSLGVVLDQSQSLDFKYKSMCKVVSNDPEDWDRVNIYECPFYLSNMLKF